MRTQKRKEKHRKNQILQNRIIRDKKKKKNFFIGPPTTKIIEAIGLNDPRIHCFYVSEHFSDTGKD